MLFPRSLELRVTLTTELNRYSTITYLFVMLFASWFIGYLIRLIGGPIERIVIMCVASVLCLIGLLSSIATPLPQQLLIHDLRTVSTLRKRTEENITCDSSILSRNDNTLFINLAQSVEFYCNTEDKEEFTDRLMAIYVREREMLFSVGWKEYVRPFRRVVWRWLRSSLAITVLRAFWGVMGRPVTIRSCWTRSR